MQTDSARDDGNEFWEVIQTAKPNVQIEFDGKNEGYSPRRYTLTFNQRKCTVQRIATFWQDKYSFRVEFCFNNQIQATDHTFLGNTTTNAIIDWLSESTLQELYRKYEFVDRHKRALETILQTVPELARYANIASNEKVYMLIEDTSGAFNQFSSINRIVDIQTLGNDPPVNIDFYWDGCRIFCIATEDNYLLAHAIKAWICENAPPSKLIANFPFFTTNTIAEYYELGKGIEGEFINSWDQMETYFSDPQSILNYSEKAARFIRMLRAKGYDHYFRAGQVVTSFRLSRSRRHGLRNDQPYIALDFQSDYIAIGAHFPHKIQFHFKQLLRKNLFNLNGLFRKRQFSLKNYEYTSELENLLQELMTYPID